MLIHQPGPAWTFLAENIGSGTPPAALVGTGVAVGGANADGANANLLSALAQDVCYLVVGMGGVATSTEDNSALMDILIDYAGGTSYTNFIDNLTCGFSSVPAAGTVGITNWYHFPIWIPAGASIGARARKNGATATTCQTVIFAYGEPRRPDMWWCGQRVESLGISEGTSKGTSHTPGNTGTFSTYATIGTSTRRYGALQLGVNGSDGTMTAIGYYWQIGVGSSRLLGTPTFYHANATTEQSARTGFCQPLFVDIPASTAIQVRATASGTAEAHNVALYGVY